jgi:hypothetical protein
MHVADLDGLREEQRRNRWRARVTAEVRDAQGQAVSNAVVTGNWFNGGNGSTPCTTGGNGRCDLVSGNLKAGVSSISLSVADVTHPAGHVYDSGANTDPDGDSNGTTISVPTSGDGGGGAGNTDPTVDISAPATGSSFAPGDSISFIGSASDAEDGNISGGIQWSSSLDGNLSSGGSITISSLSAGDHVITAAVTDSDGASASDSLSISIMSSPPTVVAAHVASLSGSAASAPKNRWSASVTVAVHDAAHGPLANVSVTGSWSNGANGSSTCTTGGNGTCVLTKSGIKGNAASATLTITSLGGEAVTYASAENDVSPVQLTVGKP